MKLVLRYFIKFKIALPPPVIVTILPLTCDNSTLKMPSYIHFMLPKGVQKYTQLSEISCFLIVKLLKIVKIVKTLSTLLNKF